MEAIISLDDSLIWSCAVSSMRPRMYPLPFMVRYLEQAGNYQSMRRLCACSVMVIPNRTGRSQNRTIWSAPFSWLIRLRRTRTPFRTSTPRPPMF